MSNIFEKSMAVSLEIGRIGIRKKVKRGKMVLKDGEGAQPDENAIGTSKELIDSKEYDAIVSLDNSIRATISGYALPAHFKAGIYLVPVSMIEEIDDMISKYKVQRENLVGEFLKTYKQSVKEAQTRLGGLFDANDYDSITDIADAFTVEYSYIDLGLPKNLGSINGEIFKREQQAFNDKMINAAEEIQQGLRQAFRDLIEHMAERLQPGEDGKKKIFRDSLITNLAEFMERFKSRNITDDDELATLVDKARELLKGKNAEILRDSEMFRQQVNAGLGEIKTALNGMVTDAPRRKFSFDD